MDKILFASQSDLKILAECHRKAFPKALSTAMGTHYVEKMLEWYLIDERGFLFFLKGEGNSCIGYCGGIKVEGLGRDGSASSMIQHSYSSAVQAMLKRPWLFIHPEFLKKYKLALRNILKRFSTKKPAKVTTVTSSKPIEPYVGLVVIGVDPKFMGKGYGSKLLVEFERHAAFLGFKKISLTVKTDNQIAIRSYLRNGWITTSVSGNSTAMHKMIQN